MISLLAVVAACSDSGAGTSTSGAVATPPDVTTLPPITTLAATTTTTTTTTTTQPPEPVDPVGVAAEVAALIETAEETRGLGFLVAPEVVVLDSVEFASTVRRLMGARHDELRSEALTLFYRLVGMRDDGDDLAASRRELQDLPEVAWYDDASGSLLVADRQAELGPLGRSEVVHEIVHALTDQHFDAFGVRSSLLSAGADDRLDALDALIEGDATYFQVVYIQGLPEAEQQEIATAFLSPSPDAVAAPAWLIEDLVFPFDAGFDFVADLVAGGGIAAVDRAYLDPPSTTEQVLHPERYRRGEISRLAGPSAATVEGYTELPSAGFGEWNLRLLLADTLSPGMLTQTADGWGGDQYQLFISGSGAVAFSYAYVGDAEAHTEEMTQAFIDFAEDVLELGEGTRTDGGVAYARNGRPWVFIDREAAGLLVVIASDGGVGADLAAQLSPP